MGSPEGYSEDAPDSGDFQEVHRPDNRDNAELPNRDAHYTEVSITQSIPTKTGDEDTNSAHHVNSRPGTAGTAASVETELDFETSQLLEENTATMPLAREAVSGPLVFRREPDEDRSGPESFQYQRAQPLSMVLKRHLPPQPSFMAPQPNTGENEIDNDLSHLKAPLPLVQHSMNTEEETHQQHVEVLRGKATTEYQQQLPNGRLRRKRKPGSGKRRRRSHGESRQAGQMPVEIIPLQDQEHGVDQGMPVDKGLHPSMNEPNPIDCSKVDTIDSQHVSGTGAETDNNGSVIPEDTIPVSHMALETTVPEAPEDGNMVNNEPDTPHSQIRTELNAVTVEQSENLAVAPVETHQDPSELATPQTQEPHDHPAPPVKRRLKKRKRSAVEGPADRPADVQDHYEPEYYMQMALNKMQEKQQSQNLQFQADLELKQSQLDDSLKAKQELETELASLQQQKQTLHSTMQEQRGKLIACVDKLKKFKTFIDGLGRDANALKKEVNIARQDHDELAGAVGKKLAQKTAVIEELNECSKKSAQWRNSAIKLQIELKAEMERFQLRSVLLTQELNNKMSLLAEERTRRSQLETTLNSSPETNSEVITLMEAHKTGIMAEFAKIQELTQSSKTVQEDGKMAEKLLEKLADLVSGQSANADRVNDLRELTESLKDGMQTLSQTTDLAEKRGQSDALKAQTHIESTLKDLKGILDERERFMRQEASHRETIAKLQEQIKGSVKDVDQVQQQLSLVEKREVEIKEQNSQLQTKISEMEEVTAADQEAKSKLNEIEAKLAAKERSLQSAKADEAVQAEEMKRLKTMNSTLQEDMRNLQEEIKKLENVEVNFEPQRVLLHRQHQEALEALKTKMMEETNQFAAEERMKFDNELQSLANQKETLQRKVDSMPKNLHADAEREKRELEQKVKALEQEVSTARVSLKDLEAIKERNITLANQITSVKTKSEQQLNDLKQTMQKDFATANSMQSKELSEAKEEARRSKAGLQQYQETSRVAMEDEKKKHLKELEALQASLCEREEELQKNKEADENFRVQVEQTWNEERETHLDEMAKIRHQAEEAMKAKEEATKASKEASKAREVAVAEIERLKQEYEALKEQQADLRKEAEDITPLSRGKENQPPRPRKPSFSRSDAGMPIPTPDQLRRQSSGAMRVTTKEPLSEDLQVEKPKGPVVEETQFEDIIQPHHSDIRNAQPKDRSSTFSDVDFDVDLDAFFANESALQPTKSPAQPLVDVSANEPVNRGQQSAFSVPSIRNSQPQIRSSFFSSSAESATGTKNQQSALMTVKDSQEMMAPRFTSRGSASRENRQQSLPSSQADDEQYTYKKTFAHPNSGSKLMRRPSDAAAGMRRHQSNISERSSLQSSYSRQGTAAPLGGISQSQANQLSSSHSSSPDFVTAGTLNARTRTNSQTFGNSNLTKHHRAKTGAGPTVDPRLARRDPAEQQKRKADEGANALHERESKRRASVMHNETPQKGGRYSLRNHQSVTDVPSLPTTNINSSSRMRTLAGTVAGSTRRSRKQSKNDDYDAVFSHAASGR